MKRLTSAQQVMDALGGRYAVMKLTGAKRNSTWNWGKNFRRFPAKHYRLMTDALKRRGYTAPPHLWKQTGFPKETNRAA